jgi:hypothetical protein
MNLTIEEAQAKASRVVSRLKGFNVEVALALALDIVADVYGDENWQAMHERLQKSEGLAPAREMPKLRVFTVALYRRHEAGEINFEGRLSVLCQRVEEAKQVVFDRFWRSEYDSVGYRVDYQSEELPFHGMPALDCVIDWISESPAIMWIWRALVSMGASAVYGEDQRQPALLENALLQAARWYSDAEQFFWNLYRELPVGEWLSTLEQGHFEVVDETLTFAPAED